MKLFVLDIKLFHYQVDLFCRDGTDLGVAKSTIKITWCFKSHLSGQVKLTFGYGWVKNASSLSMTSPRSRLTLSSPTKLILRAIPKHKVTSIDCSWIDQARYCTHALMTTIIRSIFLELLIPLVTVLVKRASLSRRSHMYETLNCWVCVFFLSVLTMCIQCHVLSQTKPRPRRVRGQQSSTG